MLEVNGNNDAARMLDGDCKIYVQESEKLLGPKKSQNLQINIEFNDLCYSARDRKGTEKTILRNVTGHFETGKVTVIIGPSGVGKTTLLKIISGRRLIGVTGNIIVNGVERNIGTFRKQVCYVPQQFHLLPLLTTKETFYIAARLKLNINQNEAIHLIINEIAKNLGLLNCLDTLASKLSGGEQRRLSIGVEMITRPSVFLLDEPTSGLDSVASNQLVNILHDMARANCTVVCTIHQPSSQMISLFDDIMVLDRGRCIYCGPKSEILNTYSIAGFTCPNFYNIAEFVLEVTTEQKDGDLENLYNICREEYEKFKSRTEYNKNKLEPSTDSKQKNETCNKDTSINSIIQKKSTWEQQKVLFLRALICIKRDNILCTSSYVFISYYMTGQPMELDRILGVWVICLLITILGQTVGIFVGTAFGIELGVFLIPATSIPFYIFGGFFMKIEETSIYLQPLGVLSFIRYAFEGMMQAVYLDRPKLSCSEMYCHWRSPNKILSMMGIPTVPFYVTLLILVSWILCLHTIAYALFRWKIYHAEK
ncbi:PREDICTED: ATP-binding cassette sub-family G member 1-like isoform X2 [Wasmannia auropunctata]|uniref:ATP-binding cassette sub-family G member 1-like isoform X2 n=1 Tax=Wasmannia auropunctata TaxID=64793 RepID=UPI0005EE1540|nr:PREDICTED: ATP-binding cassette sub-family G member 1-like isoform X2 [Wasmannia auropunctata]